MKTIEINVYSFDELHEDIQERLIQEYRETNDISYLSDEYRESLEAFCSLFGIKWHSFDEYYIHYSLSGINDEVLQLSGKRMMAYFWNNFKGLFNPTVWNRTYLKAYKGKLNLHLMPKCPFMFRINTDYKGTRYFTLYSKLRYTECCNLTGVCYDYSLLQPIWNIWTDSFSFGLTVEDVLINCLESFRISYSKETEYLNSDEYIRECLRDQGIQYTKSGKEVTE